MKVADTCTREVVAAGRSTSLREAAALMVVGIVTDRDDLLDAMAHEMCEVAASRRAPDRGAHSRVLVRMS